MQIVSHSTDGYFNRQVNWFNGVGNDVEPEPEVEILPQDVAIIHPQNDAQNISLCMVCMYNNNNNSEQHIIIPCGHAWICNVCIVALPEPARCPLCRLENITFQRIFLNN